MQSLAELDLVNTSSSEESALASALATRDKQHSLLYFYSANCLLCQSIAPAVQQEQERSRSWLNVATVCTDDHRKWAPEMINYQVESVPCFVLLDKKGQAIARSGRPRNKAHVAATLQTLLRIVKPKQHS